MNEVRTREVSCRYCKRRATVPVPEAQGHPYGWFYLTVSVPPWFNSATGKMYRAVGLFCSAECLARGLPDITRDEEMHRNAYEHE
jgi:hypothetical protein